MASMCLSRLRCSCQVSARKRTFAPFRTLRTPRLRPVIASSIDFDGLALSIPDIDGDAKSYQLDLGAELNALGVVRTFGQKDKVLTSLDDGVVLVDRSHWGRLRLGGPNTLSFLQPLVAQGSELQGWKAGQGGDLDFLGFSGSAGRCLALVQERGVLLVVPPGSTSRLANKLDVAALPEHQVVIRDISAQCAMFSLIGPKSPDVLRKLGAGNVVDAPYGSHTVLKMKDKPVLVVVGSGLPAPGYTILPDESIAGDLYAALVEQDSALMGEEEWELVLSLMQAEVPEVAEEEGEEQLSTVVVDVSESSASSSVDKPTTASSTSSNRPSSVEPQTEEAEPAETEPAASTPAPPEPIPSIPAPPEPTPSIPSTPEPTPTPSASYPESTPYSSPASTSVDQPSSGSSGSSGGGYSDDDDSSSSSSLESAGQDDEDLPVNKWRLIVDRALLPVRKARVVDIEAIQRHANPSLWVQP